MIKFLRRAIGWWLDELCKPFRSDVQEPIDWDDSSEPVEPKPDFSKIKRDPTPGIYNPDGITARDLANLPVYGQPKGYEVTDRDLLSDDEKALWADIEGDAPKHKPIQYPPKVDEQDARDWVTDELKRRTGGLTRHPFDLTNYPEPPTETDKAAREYVASSYSGPRALFSHGYSMRYLGELLSRAKRKDRSLSTEDLMALRSRGLI